MRGCQIALRIPAVILTLCAIVRGAELPTAEPESVGLDHEVLAEIGPEVEQLIENGESAGAVVLIARRGKVVYGESFGLQNVATERAMRADTIFRFYSMSKPVTSVAAMMLVDEGVLELDEAVSKHLPELAERRVFVQGGNDAPAVREMTVRDLLRHTSGLTYGFFGETEVDRRYLLSGILAPTNDLEEMISRLAPLPLLDQPGTRFNYSVATDVLGRIVEVASNQKLDAFFQERIFQPLEMQDTAFHVPEDKRDRFAANYTPAEGGGLQLAEDPSSSPFLQPPRLLSGGGGLVSTARDYLRFCQMLMNEGELDDRRLLEPETVRDMTSNQLPDAAYPIGIAGDQRDGIGFGLGFSVVVEETNGSAQPEGEYGWGGMASTHFWISPQHELAVVALQQRVPFTFQLESLIKPIVYRAVIE